MDSNLYVTETTNNNYNMTLYELLSPKTVMSWVRAMVANRLSNTAPQWCNTYAIYNSGTYNNQWVVVDHNLFTPGIKQLKPNTVWVLEQIPGYIEAADVTGIVNDEGYWGGYNVPYFPYIFQELDYEWAVQNGGAESSRNCSRALIMARDAHKVNSVEDMKKFMQYNDWQHDPLSGGNACNSIASRFDLYASDPSAYGAYDAKVTSHKMMSEIKAWAMSGPTHQGQTPFSWNENKDFAGNAHMGQPDTFDFDWVLMS